MNKELRPGELGYRRGLFRVAAARRDMRLSAIAREWGVSYNHLILCLAERQPAHKRGVNWRVPSKELAQKIAAFLGMPLHDLYPEVQEFLPAGGRLGRRSA